MLVVVAVNAQIFPIAAVGGVVIVIAISMVHRKKVQVVQFEFPTALGADPAVKLERFFPVIFMTGTFGPHFLDQDIGFFPGHRFYRTGSA